MKIPRYINSNRRTINQFVGINQQRIPAALLLDFGSDVFETRRNDHRRNSRRHQLFDNGGHMAVPYNLVEVGVNFLDGPAVPQIRITPAEFLVRDLPRKPLLQMVTGCTFPNAEPLMNVLPGARDSCESSVQIENYRRNHLESRTRFRNSFRVF